MSSLFVAMTLRSVCSMIVHCVRSQRRATSTRHEQRRASDGVGSRCIAMQCGRAQANVTANADRVLLVRRIWLKHATTLELESRPATLGRRAVFQRQAPLRIFTRLFFIHADTAQAPRCASALCRVKNSNFINCMFNLGSRT